MVLGIGEGRVELILDKTSYVPGDTIKGKVNLFLNKPEQASQLRVEFYGEIERHSGRNRATERVFEVQKSISGEKTYSNGEAFDFEITVPANAIQPKPSGIILSLFSAFQPVPRWYVQACLDMPMKFDMNKKVPVQLLAPKMPVAGV